MNLVQRRRRGVPLCGQAAATSTSSGLGAGAVCVGSVGYP